MTACPASRHKIRQTDHTTKQWPHFRASHWPRVRASSTRVRGRLQVRMCRDGHTRSGCHSTTQSQQSAALPLILGHPGWLARGRGTQVGSPSPSQGLPHWRPTEVAAWATARLGRALLPPAIQLGEEAFGEPYRHRCVAALREGDVVVGQLRSTAVLEPLRRCGRRSASRRRSVLRRVLDPVQASHVSRGAIYADYLPLVPTYTLLGERGIPAGALVANALAEGPLPAERPAAALYWRILQRQADAEPSVAYAAEPHVNRPSSRPRPELLRRPSRHSAGPRR